MTTNVTTPLSNSEVNTLRARAPGKIILSGEHAVVYGSNAIAVAVQEYTTVQFSPVTQSKVINTLFSGISTGMNYPLNAVSKLKHRLDERFESFTKGDIPVQHILSHPNDLAMYALSTLMHQLPSRKSLSSFLPSSGMLRSESTIPTGSGMGSSASAIAATLVLYEDILDKHLNADQRFDLVRFCERLQHGKGSAIDAATVTYGGANRVRNHEPERIQVHLDKHWYWLHTGTPSSSTGECVQFVRKYYGKDQARWDAFNSVTHNIEHILAQADITASAQNALLDAIKANHALLKDIDIVPNSVSKLIEDIEHLGGAGKISGAGSISGSCSGLVLMYLPADDVPSIINTLNKNNLIKTWGVIHQDLTGATRIR